MTGRGESRIVARSVPAPALWWLAGLVLAALTLAALWVPSAAGAAEKVQPVRVAAARRMDVPIHLDRVGNLTAFSTVNLLCQVSGQLQAVHFKEGDKVKTGQLMFTVDPSTYQAKLKSSQAALAAGEAQLKEYLKELKRQQTLQKKGFATKEALDQAQANVSVQQATNNQDRAEVDLNALELGYTKVTSPIDGRTGLIQVKPGNLVSSSDSTPLVTIYQYDPIFVDFGVPESHLSVLQQRMALGPLTVEVTEPGDTSKVHKGLTTFLDPQVNAKTGTVNVRAQLKNPSGDLWPGRFVKVRLIVKMIDNALVVPLESVQMNQGGYYVYVLDADRKKVDLRRVKVGEEYEGLRIITDGLKEGETVVTFGQMNLRPGAPVKVLSQAAPTAATGAK